jgi:peptidoglycan/xylan/chitin deacetylase (PgdA/CDA1 family)
MYHSISQVASRRFRRFAVSPEHFEEHLRLIRESGFVCVTVSALVEMLRRPYARLPAPCIALTFDDGLEDFFTSALPLLVKYAMVGTLYVVTGYVGERAQWLADSGEGERRMLSWSQIAAVSRAGIEIGAHTVTHPALDTIPVGHARAEICNSKHELEDRIGRQVRSFAYPFGFYDRAVRELVEEAGFESACAVRYATSSRQDDRFALPRHIVRGDARGRDIGALLAGRAPAWPLMRDRACAGAWKLVRHAVARMNR